MIDFGLDERSGVATMSAHRKPGLSRRRFLNAAAGTGASAAGLTACTSSGPVRPAATGRGLADVVLGAFKTHRLVPSARRTAGKTDRKSTRLNSSHVRI